MEAMVPAQEAGSGAFYLGHSGPPGRRDPHCRWLPLWRGGRRFDAGPHCGRSTPHSG